MLVRSKVLLACTVFFPLTFALANGTPKPEAPQRLRTEYLENPLGIDATKPRFSWAHLHDGRSQKQTAYQAQVATEADFGSLVWDTWKASGAESTHLVYGGKPLQSSTTYYWRVKWWDRDGVESPFSKPATFETALLEQSEWKSQWIGGADLLRSEFELTAAVKSARAYVTGLGYYELRLNGEKAGNRVLDPGFSVFEKRVLYSTYDVTPQLKQGRNAVAIMLGGGWYGQAWKKPVAARMELRIELSNGETVHVRTDPSKWRAHAGPITGSGIYHGEDYDARLEQAGWDRPGFDDSKWSAAVVVPMNPAMSAQMMPAIEVADTVAPYGMSQPSAGVYVFDLHQNLTGWAQIKVKGSAGTRVRIRYAEMLDAEGNIDVENLRYARSTDTYILRGDPEGEVYEPRFTYHGFRYIELAGFPGVPTLESVRGRIVHTAFDQTGNFACSNPVLNGIQQMTIWTLKGNLMSIPTDGAQRDERMGWMADAHLSSESAMLNFDAAAFYSSFLRSIKDEQEESGAVPDVVPWKTFGKREGDPAWASGYPLMVWFVYERYGDRRVLEEHFDGIKSWADFLTSRSSGHLVSYSYYGDWVSLEKTSGELVSSAYYYYSTDIVARAAKALGKSAEEAKYRALANQIRDAFNAKYLKSDATYSDGSQTAAVLPLYLMMTPDAVRKAAMSELTKSIIYHHNTHATTGIHGTKYLFPLLTMNSQSELAYDLLASTEYPSFGFMLSKGATTFWELWQHKAGPKMNSHNHPAFSSVGTWLYEAVAGIRTNPEKPGYEEIRFEPQITRDLKWASASIDSPRGEIRSEWRRTPTGAVVDVVIPPNSTATVHLPKMLNNVNPVMLEGGKVIWENGAFVPGVTGISGATQVGYPVHTVNFEVGSGRYSFEIRVRE